MGALTFEERDARTVLLTRDELVTVAPDVTPHEVEAVAAHTGYSRFPVARDGDLIGYLHLKDALEIEEVHRHRPIASASIRDLSVVDASEPLRTVLAAMQRSKSHLARVTAEDGHTLGVVALEDVLEELVGEIRDEMQRRVA